MIRDNDIINVFDVERVLGDLPIDIIKENIKTQIEDPLTFASNQVDQVYETLEEAMNEFGHIDDYRNEIIELQDDFSLFLVNELNTKFNLVDLIVWDKDKIGMGYRSRRKSEYLAVFQKSPVRAKDCWTLHNIPDVWTEKISKEYKNHPHSKPIELQKQLILATTKPGDIILDPAAGGFSVLTACQQL